MKALVTVATREQFLISRTRVIKLDEMGKETKQQCSITVAPVLKPGVPLIYGSEGEVITEAVITGVIYKG